MSYRLGKSNIINDISETTELECPNCKNKVKFKVMSNFNVSTKKEFPYIDTGNLYFLVCPKCASIYTVDERVGKNFEKGDKLSLGNFDIKNLKKFK